MALRGDGPGGGILSAGVLTLTDCTVSAYSRQLIDWYHLRGRLSQAMTSGESIAGEEEVC